MLRSQRLKSSCTVAHNCHGKRNNLAAKEKDSRQKGEPHGKKEKTRGKRKKPYNKRKNLTALRKDSRQNKKPHGKKKRLTAKEITSRQTKYQCPHGIKESV